jgi:hypothetical protein
MKAVPFLGWLVAGFPPRGPVFGPRSYHVEFVVEKVAWGKFSRFTLPILIPSTAPPPPSFGAGTLGPLVAVVLSGLSLTPLHRKIQ